MNATTLDLQTLRAIQVCRALARLESLGNPVIVMEMSEATKMDGGLSCLSLRFQVTEEVSLLSTERRT